MSITPEEHYYFGYGRKLLVALAAFVALTEIAPLFGYGQAPHTFALDTLLFEPLVNSAMLSLLLLYFLLPVRRGEALLVFGVGVPLEIWFYAMRAPVRSTLTCVADVGLGLGLGALVGFAVRILSRPEEREAALGWITLGVLSPIGLVAGGWLQIMVIRAHPQVYDLYGYLLDSQVGFHPCFVVATFVVSHRWLFIPVYLVYNELPLLLTAATVLCIKYPSRTYVNVLATVIMGGLGTLLYNVFPMVGVDRLAANFPFHVPVLHGPPHLVKAPWTLPRNCMPSLHIAWIVVAFCSVRGINRRVWGIGCLLLCLTVISTVTVGGHYSIDLVAGLPVALACVGGFARRGPARWRTIALVTGVVLTALELAGLRLFTNTLLSHPAITLTAQAALVASFLIIEGRLWRCAVPRDTGTGRTPE